MAPALLLPEITDATPGSDPGQAGPGLLQTQPLWDSLPAVAAGRVHEQPQSLSDQSGPTATAFLDVVERALLGGPSS